MTENKHTVATDALATLGTIIDASAGRDAIHLAVEPVVALERLQPGQDVGLIDGKASSKAATMVGIVDPFLKGSVPAGERFWLVVYPRQITSLRHVWEHPAFQPSAASAAAPADTTPSSERWIRDYAAKIPLAYDVLMDGARDWVESQRRSGWGEYLCFGGLLEGEVVPDEFWTHYQNVTGEQVEDGHRGSFFTCSC